MSEHKLDWCGMCGWMVRCGTCGNNSCNGSYGEITEGDHPEKCKDCPAAYDLQDYYLEEEGICDLIMFLLHKREELQAESGVRLAPVGAVMSDIESLRTMACKINDECIELYTTIHGTVFERMLKDSE